MKLLTAAETARLIGVPTIQLRRARDRGAGPPATMLNGVGYIYDADAVQAWLADGNGPGDLRTSGRELRPHPRGTDEWFDIAKGDWCPINRRTDPRYRPHELGKRFGYALKD
jgi:hypothetical protein